MFRYWMAAAGRFRANTRGQDLIEYALLAGFVAMSAGAVIPGVASSLDTVFSKINSVVLYAQQPLG